MKNRIISLLLVVVSCVLLLTGCAFNYQKKDLTTYASFDLEDFEKLLAKVEVEDGEFVYGDEDIRAAMVADEIYARLVKLAKAEDKVTTGELAEKNILYYCYFVTAVFEEKVGDTEEKEDVTYTFYATNMTESKFQTLALYDLTKVVDKKIMETLLDIPYTFVEGESAYTTKLEGNTEGGKVIYVTYKETAPDGTTTEYTNKQMKLPVLPTLEEGEEFTATTLGEYLVAQEIGKTLTDFEVGEEGSKTKYTSIKVNWQVETGEEIVVDFDENPFETTTSQKSDNGKTKNLKDAKSVKYHIYPVGRQEIEELTEENGKLVFTTLLGDGISTTSLECLANVEYKYTDDNGSEITIKALVEELAGKYKALSDAKTAYDKTPSNTTLKENYEKAQADVADDKLDEYWEKMKKCAQTKEEDLGKLMYTQYTEDVYDELEEDYNAEIQDKVTVELWKLIQQAVTNVSAPERAVKDAYKQNLEAFKYKYYTGKVNDSTATDAATNLETYKTFKDYLVAAAKKVATEELEKKDVVCDTYAQAEAILNEYAEKQVKEHIVIWTVAKAYDIEVADTEIENFALLQSYYMQIYGYSITSDQILDQYGKENIRTYLAFDKLIGYFLEVEEDNADTEEDESKNGTAYKNITVKRNPVETEEDADDETTGDDTTGDDTTGDDTTGDDTTGDENE